MNTFSYRPYYEFKPSGLDPLSSPKSEEDAAYALARFPEELPHFLPDEQATVSISPQTGSTSGVIVVVTTLDEPTTDKAVAKCLNGLGLFADKIPKI